MYWLCAVFDTCSCGLYSCFFSCYTKSFKHKMMRTNRPQQNALETAFSSQSINQKQHQNHQYRKIPNQWLSNPELIKQAYDVSLRKNISNNSNLSYLTRNFLNQKAPREALLVYIRSRRGGVYPYGQIPLILKACATLLILSTGKALHAELIKFGMDFDIMVGTSLVSMYAKCGDMLASRRVFENMPERNVVTWNAMIGGYLKNGEVGTASFLFKQMPAQSAVTWIQMIDGFSRSGDTVSARCLFDQVPPELKNVVTWTVMVDGYASNGEMEAARQIFEQMPQRNCYAWSSMVSGYCKKSDVKEARDIFDRIPLRNLVNWNALIAGCAQNGLCEEALEAFGKMRAEGFEPDEVTVASTLSACAQLGLLDVGKEIHDLIIHKGIKLNQFVLNGLVDMYAKCGYLDNARQIFEGMAKRNDVCWNAMISGFAIHGQSEKALELFHRMEVSSEKPNGTTFLSVLSACAHGGFVEEGLEIFSKLQDRYGLAAGIEHYGCLVDLLGRAGKLREAYSFIKRMPMKPNEAVWGSLLGACRIHSDVEMADRVMEEVGIMGSEEVSGDNAHYVLLSNIYAASDRWEKAEKMRMMMVDNGVQKTLGFSSIVLGRKGHRYHSGPGADPWIHQLYNGP